MKAYKVIIVVLMLFSSSTTFAKPKTAKATPTATPHPATVLVSFTFTMTDFAMRHLANAEATADGISQPICGEISGLLPLGKHRKYIWESKGRYVDPTDPTGYYANFRTGRYNNNVTGLVDVTADVARDIFGADAISDVKEIPYEEFQRQQQAEERVQIIDALKLSAGSVGQAAVRLGMKDAELRNKMIRYGIPTGKQ